MRTEPLTSRPIPVVNKHFFEVSETPVRYRDIIDEGIFKRYPGKKIIRNHNLNQGISLVNSAFLPVSHAEAFNIGVVVFELLFGITPTIHKEALSAETTDYSVDLVSDSCRILFDKWGYRYDNVNQLGKAITKREQMERGENIAPGRLAPLDDYRQYIVESYRDEYHPFIRVSNYLREGASFSIELGYYRHRCTNGVMYDSTSKMTFKHPYDVANVGLIKGAALDHFMKYKDNFMTMAEKLWRLLQIHIPKAQLRLVTFDIFAKQLGKKSPEERRALHAELSDLVDKYVKEIGENMNAAVNVATEFSKLLEGTDVSQSAIQSAVGKWIDRFARVGFDIDGYLEHIRDIEG